MAHQYNIYIDEAGDDGLAKFKKPRQQGGASHWLTSGACIVSVENDASMVAWRDEIRAGLSPGKAQKRTIHFQDLNHNQRRFACQLLASKQIGIVAALSNKRTLHSLPKDRFDVFKRKNQLYSYVTRYVLERASNICKRHALQKGGRNCTARVIFSRRGGMHYDAFKEYMTLIKEGREVIPSKGIIDWDVIDPDRIEAQDHGSRAGLQLADVVTSAIHLAVEPDGFGNYESGYANALRRRVLKGPDGVALGFGIVPMPNLHKSPLSKGREYFLRVGQKISRPPDPNHTALGAANQRSTQVFSGACLPPQVYDSIRSESTNKKSQQEQIINF